MWNVGGMYIIMSNFNSILLQVLGLDISLGKATIKWKVMY